MFVLYLVLGATRTGRRRKVESMILPKEKQRNKRQNQKRIYGQEEYVCPAAHFSLPFYAQWSQSRSRSKSSMTSARTGKGNKTTRERRLSPTVALSLSFSSSSCKDLYNWRKRIPLANQIFFFCLSIGINPPPRPPSPRRNYRTIPESPGFEIQLRQDDLPEMLRPIAAAGYEL